jgi:hypothetical protein
MASDYLAPHAAIELECSAEIIGRWLAKRPHEIAERVVIATKGRFATGADPNEVGLSRRHLAAPDVPGRPLLALPAIPARSVVQPGEALRVVAEHCRAHAGIEL